MPACRSTGESTLHHFGALTARPFDDCEMKQTHNQAEPRHVRPAGGAKPVRIALVEDQADMRESWSRLISGLPGFTCICACASAEEALSQLPALQPDVVVMDIKMPGMNGIECTARLKMLLPRTQVLILTVGADSQTLFRALAAGARGCLLKRSRPEQLQTAIHEVLAGGAAMPGEVARHVIASFRRESVRRRAAHRLSPAEEKVLQLLARGFDTQEIAEELARCGETLCGHLQEIYEKLHGSWRLDPRPEAEIHADHS